MPDYKFHIFVCQNQRPEGHKLGCCASKGAQEILTYLKAQVKALGLEKIRVNKSGCLDQCQQGPAVVVYPDSTWYQLRDRQDVDDFIQAHLLQQTQATHLLIQDMKSA